MERSLRMTLVERCTLVLTGLAVAVSATFGLYEGRMFTLAFAVLSLVWWLRSIMTFQAARLTQTEELHRILEEYGKLPPHEKREFDQVMKLHGPNFGPRKRRKS